MKLCLYLKTNNTVQERYNQLEWNTQIEYERKKGLSFSLLAEGDIPLEA